MTRVTSSLVLVAWMIAQTTATLRALPAQFTSLRQTVSAHHVQAATQTPLGGEFTERSGVWKLSGKAVWWLHIPKTGGSFGFSTSACNRAPGRSEALYQALPAVTPPEMLYSVVTMLRRPSQRLASAHWWMQAAHRDHFSCCVGDWGWRPAVYERVRKEVARNASLGETLGMFQGCQTNVIMGHGCMSARPYNKTDVDEAKRRVRMFLFVGIVERWASSMCLFNFLLTGERFIMAFQLTGRRHTDLASHSVLDYDETGLPRDTADEEVYDEAVRRFDFDVQQHNITLENCPIRAVPVEMNLTAFQYYHVPGVVTSDDD